VAEPERTLTQRELNRALLARQLLLERATMPLPRAVEAMGGVQAQYAPSAYVGLWSRLAGFGREDLTRALERRTVIQGTLMRVTIHVVSRGDYWPLALAIREPARRWWLRTRRELSEAEIAAAAQRLREVLAHRPRSLREVSAELGARSFNGAALWAELVRVPPSGTWERRRADIYALAEQWVGAEPKLGQDDAVDHLVRRYLGAFGPAARTEIAEWAGVPVSTIAPALERLRLRRFRGEDGAELVDLPRAPLPDPDTPAPVRFLPTWDATLLVHARRTQILPERYRARVFHVRTPHSVNTFLVGGAVAGTWRYDKGRIDLDAFHPLPRLVRRELEEEAERLAAFHA
jgi:hypothetical protein